MALWRRRYDRWLDRHPLEGRRLLLVRIVYFVIIPGLVVSGIVLGDFVLAAVLAAVSILSLLRAPRDRRNRVLGRRA